MRHDRFALGETIRLISWNESPNFGDILSPYIVSRLCDSKIELKRAALPLANFAKCLVRYPHLLPKFVLPFQKNLLAVGSVLNLGNSRSVIWGSGFMNGDDAFFGGEVCAVRGQCTERKIMMAGGSACGVYGDPALLLPLLYNPVIKKKHKTGIIPHWREIDAFSTDFRECHVIDLRTDDVETVIDDILSCERVLSSSLHGLIVAHAYGIPALWVKRGDIGTDGFKFMDYFSSVGISSYDGFAELQNILKSEDSIDSLFIRESSKALPHSSLKEIRNRLLDAAPFPLKRKYKHG